MSSNSSFDVIVVGAGLSGLLAAAALQQRGRRVVVLDKARGVGGRMATRRIESQSADHGAQFFTAHDPVFRGLVEGWVGAGVARRWSTGFSVPDGSFRDNGVPRYCGVPGMTGIAKHLAKGLDVQVASKVVRAESVGPDWVVTTEAGTSFAGRALLLTAPVPQSLAILAAGKVPLPEPLQSELSRIDYAPGLTLLAGLAGPSRIPAPGGMWMSGEPLFWLTDNRLKGVSSAEKPVVTIHAGQEFSEEHWDSPEAEVTGALLEAASPWLASEVEWTQLHRWKFAVPRRPCPGNHALIREPAPLAFAGDAFGGPRIEAAALSGLAAAEALATGTR